MFYYSVPLSPAERYTLARILKGHVHIPFLQVRQLRKLQNAACPEIGWDELGYITDHLGYQVIDQLRDANTQVAIEEVAA